MRGQRIRCVHVFHPIATRPQSARHLAKTAEGRRIVEVERRGKYLLLVLDRGLIEMHFRLDGQLVWFSSARELLKRANAADDGVHVDVALELRKGVLGFADDRHFGRVHAWESAETCPPLRALGIDRLSREFTAKELRARLSRSAAGEGVFSGPDKDRGDWQHLLVRGAVAGTCGSEAEREFIEEQRGCETAQSDCVRSLACFKMLLRTCA